MKTEAHAAGPEVASRMSASGVVPEEPEEVEEDRLQPMKAAEGAAQKVVEDMGPTHGDDLR